MFADLGLDLVGQARGKVAARQVQLGVEQRESAAFLGQFDRGQIRGVTHVLGDFGGHGQRFLRVVTQLEHVQGIAQARETEADTALVHGFLLLVGERPVGGIEHVVQHAGRDLDDFAEGSEIESSLFSEWVADKMRQIDRAQAAAAIGRQRLFGTRVGGFDQFAVVQVVVLVHAIQEQDARFGVVVGGLHHLIPQITGTHLAVDPQAVFALVGTFGQDVFVRFCNVNQFNGIVRFNRFHERISHADRDVEVGQVALVFGMDEQLDIRMIATHDTHLGTTACTGRFHGFARAVEHAHVRDRARSARVGTLNAGTLRANRREVVPDATTTTHGFGRFGQCGVDARATIDGFDDRITDRLHEAVDQRRLQVGTGSRVDTASRHEAVFLCPQELAFPLGTVLFIFDLGQGAGHTGAHFGDGLLVTLGVFLNEHFGADFLWGQGGACAGSCLLGICLSRHCYVPE